MDQAASPAQKLLWLSLPTAAGAWQLFEALRLAQGELWAHYLGEPAPGFWALILALVAVAALRPVTSRWLRAGLFVWLAVLYGVLPTQGGSMAAHPDYFLEEAIDRTRETIVRARSAGALPLHAVDLRKLLNIEAPLHYRRGTTRSISAEIRVHDGADGPHLSPGDRPGLIHVARSPKGPIWITATGLDFARFASPTMLSDRRGEGPLVIELTAKAEAP